MGIVVLVAMVAVTFSVAFWYFSENATIRRQLRKAPAKRIAELGDAGLGKIAG